MGDSQATPSSSQRSTLFRQNLQNLLSNLYDFSISQVQSLVTSTVDAVHGLAHHPTESQHPSSPSTIPVSECNVSILSSHVRDVVDSSITNPASDGVHAASSIENSNNGWSEDEDFIISNPNHAKVSRKRKCPLRRRDAPMAKKSQKPKNSSKPKKSKPVIKSKAKFAARDRLRRKKRVNNAAKSSSIAPFQNNITGNWNIPAPSHHFGPGNEYVPTHTPPPHVNYYISSDDEVEIPSSQKRKSTLQTGGGKTDPNSKGGKGGKGKVKKSKNKTTDTDQDESSNPDSLSPSTQNSEYRAGNRTSTPQPLWNFVDTRMSKRFGVRESWYDFVGDIPDHATVREVLSYIASSLEELRQMLLEGTSQRDYVRLVLVSDQLNIPIAFPWSTVRDFDISAILDRIERVLNSNQDFMLKPGFTIRFHHVVNPVGGYRRKMDGLADDEACLRKRSIITVPSSIEDKTCFANAIVIARYFVNNDPTYKRWSRNDRPPTAGLKKEAAKLHELAGVPLGEVDSSQYSKFQSVLQPEFRLVIYKGRKHHSRIYAGPPADKNIYLYLSESSHYNVIRNMAAFLCVRNVCRKCLEVYNDARKHECCEICPDCFSNHCDRNDLAKRDPRTCKDCNMVFLTEQCFRSHSVTLFDNETACNSKNKCLKCERVFDTNVLPGKRRDHDCSQVFCRICKDYVDGSTHECYMKVTKKSPYYVPSEKEKELDKIFQKKKKKKSKSKKKKSVKPKDGENQNEKEKEDLPIPQKYIYFDFECTQNTGSHVPNLVHASWECTNCMDGIPPEDEEEGCLYCDSKYDREITFQGRETLEQFCKWLFSEDNDGAIAIAHNSKAYDSYFLLNHLIAKGIIPEVIMNGGKIMSLRTQDPKITVKDSLNFFQMGLAKLPKTFGIQELKKGFFPHLFNVEANENYVGPLPDKKYYGTTSMMKNTLLEFNEWYDNVPQDYVFDFQKEILEYCRSDVKILHESCKLFRVNFKKITQTESNPDGIDPFHYNLTLPGACNLLFRTNYLKPDTIALIPHDGYTNPKSHSLKAGEWLHYLSQSLGIDIRHAFNGGERKIHGRYVDGYREDGDTKFVYEFLGCFFHGCNTCYQPDTINKRCNKRMGVLYNETVHRIELMKRAGYTVEVMWEHDWDRERIRPEVIPHIQNVTENFKDPLNPRHSFFGGRTDGCNLFYKVKPGEKIHYYDFTSLYPYINKFGRYPLGHPRILHSNFPPIEEIFGLIQCEITPPNNLFHPVLPYRSSGKLTFPLCAACAESLNQNKCTHPDSERKLKGVWVSEELKKALDMGYHDLRMIEVWQFDRSTQYNVETQSGGLFADYINAFMKLKQEASGYPANAKTPEEQRNYVRKYYDHEGILLDPKKIEKNPGLRAISKQIINVLWGKFAERNNLRQTKYVTTSEELLKLFNDDSVIVNDLIVMNEMVQVNYTCSEGFVDQNVNTNIILASFTTAMARLKLYSILEMLGDRVLYHDTDSVVFRTDPSLEPSDPKTGDYLGELTNEIDSSNDEHIETWLCAGPKNYSYKTNKGNTVCKVRGFTLNNANSLVINHDTLKELIRSHEEEKRTIHETKIIRDTETKTLHTVERKKDYRVVFTKRVRVGDGSETLPYGHVEIP
ncbi:uncharacterized protein LOC121416344 isoform X2 [Lytechinus variegatus]|uniref:uncharacterized protein LOC121416344 isoform X2 n=1 Tax=Lytechinus variegatus TaxID=7654 RepID=UPI001BB1B9CA|nr:uncharacterized protein LOC121416344 isoform X2 [Lytechinus variegatus]